MAESDEELEYKQAFTHRVAQARKALGWKQWQMAEALGMAQDKYKQYEGRSLIPHYLIGRFCVVARIDPDWLLTGRGTKPLKAPALVETGGSPPNAKPKKAKAKRAA